MASNDTTGPHGKTVRITLEMHPEDYPKLQQAFADGRLADLGIIDVQLPSADGRQHPHIDVQLPTTGSHPDSQGKWTAQNLGQDGIPQPKGRGA